LEISIHCKKYDVRLMIWPIYLPRKRSGKSYT